MFCTVYISKVLNFKRLRCFTIYNASNDFRYTYGKPVKGTVTLRAKLDYWYRPYNYHGDEPMVTQTFKVTNIFFLDYCNLAVYRDCLFIMEMRKNLCLKMLGRKIGKIKFSNFITKQDVMQLTKQLSESKQ